MSDETGSEETRNPHAFALVKALAEGFADGRMRFWAADYLIKGEELTFREMVEAAANELGCLP